MKALRSAVAFLVLMSAITAQATPTTVYITNTGHKYHRSWCHYLSHSKIKITKTKAVKLGYTPCKICKP